MRLDAGFRVDVDDDTAGGTFALELLVLERVQYALPFPAQTCNRVRGEAVSQADNATTLAEGYDKLCAKRTSSLRPAHLLHHLLGDREASAAIAAAAASAPHRRRCGCRAIERQRRRNVIRDPLRLWSSCRRLVGIVSVRIVRSHCRCRWSCRCRCACAQLRSPSPGLRANTER
jgi:hypothetical protein